MNITPLIKKKKPSRIHIHCIAISEDNMLKDNIPRESDLISNKNLGRWAF